MKNNIILIINLYEIEVVYQKEQRQIKFVEFLSKEISIFFSCLTEDINLRDT